MQLKEIIKKCVEKEILTVELQGQDEVEIDGLNFCNRKTTMQRCLSFVTNDKYVDMVASATHVLALVVSKEDAVQYKEILERRNGCLIISEQPEIDFYKIHESLCKETDFYPKYDFETQIGKNCKIDRTAVIEKGVIIGNNVSIGPLTVIKSGSIIDDNTQIGCNTVIGSEGFQLIKYDGMAPMHITHVGRCHICSDVFVGDNVCVCNSLFGGETYIGQGVKIDNLVHIAHNIYIGKNAVITAQVILCGSSVVEDEAWIAPNVSVLNRVTIGKGAKVGLGSVVTRDVAPHTVVYGNPAKVHN